MSLFQLPTPPVLPAADSIAQSLLIHANRTLTERISEHKNRFREFWNASVPPSGIAASLGPLGGLYLAAASESIRHIGTLAAIAGQQLDDVLPQEYYMPRLPLVVNEDGSVTVSSVEGLDDWGYPIINPDPEEQEPI